MQITGIITDKKEKTIVGQKQIEKQSVRIEEQGKDYPDSLMIDFFGEKVGQLEMLSVGDIATISFNVRTSEYNGRVYNNITGYKVNFEKKEDDSPF